MFGFEFRVSISAWSRFAASVDVYDTEGAQQSIKAIIDREVERWSSASDCVVNTDVLTVPSSSNIKRGWYVVHNSQGWQVRDRMSDDGQLMELGLKKVPISFESTLDATLDFSL